MPLLACFVAYWVWIALLFSGSATAQLNFHPSCDSVSIYKGTSRQTQIDGRGLIDDAFDTMRAIMRTASDRLTRAVWNDDLDIGNRQRVVDLLANLALRPEHPDFRRMVDTLICTLLRIHEFLETLMCVIRSIQHLRKAIP